MKRMGVGKPDVDSVDWLVLMSINRFIYWKNFDSPLVTAKNPSQGGSYITVATFCHFVGGKRLTSQPVSILKN